MNTSSISTAPEIRTRTISKRAAALALLSSLLIMPLASLGATLGVGDPFPDLTQFGLEGTLPDTKGKVVLVDFFASWCGPCKGSFPVMQELHKKYADKGLVIVAVNLDKKKEDMEDFLKKHPADFAIVRDVSNKLVSKVKIPTMPSSFILDRTGVVRGAHKGFKGEETEKQYVSEIEPLLK